MENHLPVGGGWVGVVEGSLNSMFPWPGVFRSQVQGDTVSCAPILQTSLSTKWNEKWTYMWFYPQIPLQKRSLRRRAWATSLSATDENEANHKANSSLLRASGCKWPPGIHSGWALDIPVNSEAVCRGLWFGALPSQAPSAYILGVPLLLAMGGTLCSVQFCPKASSRRRFFLKRRTFHMLAGT